MEIIKHPDERLRKPTKGLAPQGQLSEIVREMTEVMLRNKGVGLAANQVGLPYSLFLMYINNKVWVIQNPEIISRQGEVETEEGCLSLPGIKVKLRRSRKIKVRYLDEQEKSVRNQFQGLASVVFQHELNHLQGILIVDYLEKS